MAATNIRELTFEHVLETILKPAGVKVGGFPEEIFLDLTEKEKEDWLCSICYRVVNECRQCANHHKFCVTCIFAWSLTYGENSQLCPVCRNPQESYEVCKEASDKLQNRQVKCDETGCDFRAPLRIFLLHSHGRAKYSNSSIDLESLRPPRIGGRNFFLLNSTGSERERMLGLQGQLSQGHLMIRQMMMLLHLEMQLRQQAMQSSARAEIRLQQIDEVLALNEQLTEVGTILSLLLDTPLSEVRGQSNRQGTAGVGVSPRQLTSDSGTSPRLDAQERSSQAATTARRNPVPLAAAGASQGHQSSNALSLGVGRDAPLRSSNTFASLDSGLGSSSRFETLATGRSRIFRPDSPALSMQHVLFPDFDTDNSNDDEDNDENDSESFIPLWRRSLNSNGPAAGITGRAIARNDTNTSSMLPQRSGLGLQTAGASAENSTQSSTSRILTNRSQQFAPTLNLFDSSNLLESSSTVRSGPADQVSIVTLGATPAASSRPPPAADPVPIRRAGVITTSSTNASRSVHLPNLQQQVAAISSNSSTTAPPTRAQQPVANSTTSTTTGTTTSTTTSTTTRVNNNNAVRDRQAPTAQMQPEPTARAGAQPRTVAGQTGYSNSQVPGHRFSIVPPEPAVAAATPRDVGTFSVVSAGSQLNNNSASNGQQNSSIPPAASNGLYSNSSYRGLSMASRERQMPDAATAAAQQTSRDSGARVSNAGNGRTLSNVNASERRPAAGGDASNTSIARDQRPATQGAGTAAPPATVGSTIPPSRDRPAAAHARTQQAAQGRYRPPPLPASTARGTSQQPASRTSGTLLPRLNTTLDQSTASTSNVSGAPARRSQAVPSDEAHRLRMTSTTTAAGSLTGRNPAASGAQRIPSASDVPRSRRRSEIMQDILNASRR